MLSAKAMSSGQAGYYLGLAREDYYLKGGEPPGQWYGEGCAHLGLVGEVQGNHLYNLFDGYSPDGSKGLVQFQKHQSASEHMPGWDLTFSAPKSVSVLWSQASQKHRVNLQEAHLQAVKSALDYLQDTASFSRQGRQGRTLARAKIVVALFEHSTSRALDPQLHTHALVLNIGVGDDGRTRTLSGLHFFLSKMAAGAIYRLELSAQLERLGLHAEKHRSWFELSNVSEDLIDEFSKRRKAIEAALKEKGLDSPEAAAVAAIETRESKESVSRSELFSEWRASGAVHRWSTRQADALFGVFKPSRKKAVELATAATLASDSLMASQAHFTRRDFVRFMAEQAQCTGLRASEVLEGADSYLRNSKEIVRLGRHHGEERFTTQKMLDLENSLLHIAESLSADTSHQVAANELVSTFAKGRDQLSLEQLKAVSYITSETGAIAVVSGMAGAGKTRMLKTARDAWRSAGFTVFGTALSDQASEVLASDAGLQTMNIAKLLYEVGKGRNPLNSKSILVVDEAGMVATPEMEKLIRLAHDSKAKLVLIGDERQLQPIGPGAPFMELGIQFGHAELQEIQRQSEAWARKAVKDVADGKAQEALFEFIDRGLVHVYETRDEAMKALVAEWWTDQKPMDKSLILAGTHEEVNRLNAFAQAERLKAHELGSVSVRVAGTTYYEGDRLRFTKKHSTMGIAKGECGYVHGVTEKGHRMVVRLDSGEQVSFDVESMQDFTLGYASTTHRAQGSTSINTYVLAGGSMQDRELSYVQVSRATAKTALFLTRAEVGDEIASLVRSMERSHQKEMAYSFLREEQRPYDIEPLPEPSTDPDVGIDF